MKTFQQLTPEQQTKALDKCMSSLLEGILEGAISFDDELNHDDLQKRIDAACKKADEMRTPWFAHEYILDTCREDLSALAQAAAEDALYSEGERVIAGIAA